MTIETDVVFLDTGIFEKENFFRGHKIKKINELSKNGAIKVKLTDITYHEIKNRMRKNLLTARTIYKKFGETINLDAKILKNDSDYNSFYPLKKLDVDAIFKKLESQLNDFIKEGNIEIIDSSIADIQEVFDQYFKQKPPFGEGQKKDEFPDAFTLNTIKHWCKKNKKSVYVISTDNDIIKYDEDPNIKPLEDLATFIDAVSRKYESEMTIQTIVDNIKKEFDDVKSFITKHYLDEIAYQISQEYIHEYTDLEYEIPVITEIDLVEVYFIELNENSCKVEIQVDVFITLPISYDNYDMGTYDREDDRWYNVITERTELDVEAEFEFEANFEFEFDDGELIHLELSEIDNLNLNHISRDLY